MGESLADEPGELAPQPDEARRMQLSRPRHVLASRRACRLGTRRIVVPKSLGIGPNPAPIRPASRASSQAPEARRGVNSSQVPDAWISPLTHLQPPTASGGNMYLQ
jgi:hypothetical protein